MRIIFIIYFTLQLIFLIFTLIISTNPIAMRRSGFFDYLFLILFIAVIIFNIYIIVKLFISKNNKK